MNLPKRMPVRASKDRIRIQWLTALCEANVAYAVFSVLGRSDGPAQILMRKWVPTATPVWSAVLVAATAGIWLGWYVQGATVGLLIWLALGVTSIVSIVDDSALNAASPVLPLFLARLHWLIAVEVYSGMDKDRERRQRRR